jgi:hypothetical protein
MADLQISELDFDQIKDSLKNFLRDQSEFKDYDFEGSSMAVLLDLLAYNTHYNAYYMNMVANEMFLDTAQMRESVVSRAKMLGYTPRSRSSSKILVNIQLKVPVDTLPLPTSIIVPKYTQYKTAIDGKTYYFNTVESHNATPSGLDSTGENYIYSTQNIYLYEGNRISQKYTYDKNNAEQRFVIKNANVDTSTLSVRVQRSATNVQTTAFEKTTSISDLNSETPAFFLQEIEKELYEVYFGDGSMGRSLEHNNIVYIDYLSTNGPDANGANSFKFTAPIEGYTQDVVLVEGNTKSTGGAEREGIDSIRYLAPLNFNAQNRVVTSSDYKTAILQNYNDVQAVNSWGGEENDPPIYGKVYIALKPKSGFTINEVAKAQIRDSILKDKNVVSITPEIVDPKYIFLVPQIQVYYNREIGAYSATDIESDVKNAILKYSSTNLEQFNSYFKYSQFLRVIDNANTAIENSSLNLKIATTVAMVPNTPKSYSAAFSNPLFYPHDGHYGSVVTSKFTYFGDSECYISDDGYGNLNIYKTVVGERRLVDTGMGTVNYDTGQVNIFDFSPEADDDLQLTITVEPREQDIFSVRNQILEILEGDILVNATDSQTRYNSKITDIYSGNTNGNGMGS